MRLGYGSLFVRLSFPRFEGFALGGDSSFFFVLDSPLPDLALDFVSFSVYTFSFQFLEA